MKAMLAKKIGMSQVFSPTGDVIPVTLVLAEPNAITLRRTMEKDGRNAVQLGLLDKKAMAKKKNAEAGNLYSASCEFNLDIPADMTMLTLEQFTLGDVVSVSGISKGKGFQGVVKRHHFKGGPASHGHTDWTRKAGSIGSRFPQHTRKGKRMAGHMGAERVTVKNLEVVGIDAEQHVLAIKGAIPGVRGSVVEIKSVTEGAKE